MKNEMRGTCLIAVIAIFLSTVTPALSLSLEEAKTKGLVGEKPNGYLGAVNPASSDVRELTDDVNQKRRRAYEDIAKRNGTDVEAVEALAGEKAIQNTKPGHFVEGPGGWTRK